MSLVRCTQLLSRKNGTLLNVFKHSTVYYSDDKKSSDDGADQNDSKDTGDDKSDKKQANQSKSKTKSFSPESQNRLNELLKKMSSRSSLEIVKEVQGSKPIGYRKIRQNQKLDAKERKPRNVSDAAQAVSKELGEEGIKDEILAPFQGERKESEFLDDVISKMKTPAKRKDSMGKAHVTGAFTPDNARRETTSRHRKPIFNVAEELSKRERPTAEVVTDVFAGKPIGIFEPTEQLESKADTLKTWNKLEQHDLRLRMSMAPRNYFEKMAYWTEEGKIWHFPIDNEQGLDDELQTSFTEHIFLEEHLEPWCPRKGAVRNFMELVCIGLSKNPYLSVQQKREHIEWYRNYFEEKRDILQRVIDANAQAARAATQVTDGTKST